MEIKYVVIVTVYSVDGLRTSRRYNFCANVNAARFRGQRGKASFALVRHAAHSAYAHDAGIIPAL